MTQRPLQRRIPAEAATWTALILALVLLGAVTIFTLSSTRGLSPVLENVDYTRRVAAVSAQVLSDFRESQSLRRAYLLTGDAYFLREYDRRMAYAQRQLTSLEFLTRDNASQRARVRRTRTVLTRADSIGQITIQVRQRQGLEAAADMVRSRVGQNLVTDLESIVSEIEQVEQRRLASGMEVASERARRAQRIAIISAILAGIFLPGAAMIIRTDLKVRQRRNQKMREASVAAQEATRAKSEFLAGMSHEIRTPLNGVIGMIELALDTDLNHTQRDYLLTARYSAEALLRLLNDILDFSKIEAGRLDLDPAPFELRDLLADTLRTLSVRAEQKGLEMAYRVAPDVPDALVGDAGRLQQIIINLVGNAIKFTERGEIVVLVEREAAATDVGDATSAAVLHVAVRDTGIGIPADRLRAVFELFTQAESSTHRRFGGTGLGLSISERLVHMMGGRIWVESTVGEGSTFHFTVSLERGEETPPGRAKLGHLEGMRVLVVDDHPVNRTILQEMLAHWRLEAVSVATAAEGLRAARDAQQSGRPFRVGVLDFMLPDVDGYTLAAQIIDAHAMTGPSLLILSSDNQPGNAQRRKTLGISRSLMKPVKPSELLDAILVAAAPHADDMESGASSAAGPVIWHGARVLVAEDNVVNQRVAIGLLERRGASVTIANNGREALEVLHDSAPSFDLVFMDVEMPELDGIETTRRFREVEQDAAGGRLPIVALTAHALAEDRQRCLAVGMNACLTKPLRSGELDAALAEFLGPRLARRLRETPHGGAARAPSPSRGTHMITREVEQLRSMSELLGDDQELVRIVAAEFVRQTPQLVAELRQAVEAGNADAVSRIAHRIKGSAGQVAARHVAGAAGALEEQARGGRLTAAEELLREVEREAGRLVAVLDTIARSTG